MSDIPFKSNEKGFRGWSCSEIWMEFWWWIKKIFLQRLEETHRQEIYRRWNEFANSYALPKGLRGLKFFSLTTPFPPCHAEAMTCVLSDPTWKAGFFDVDDVLWLADTEIVSAAVSANVYITCVLMHWWYCGLALLDGSSILSRDMIRSMYSMPFW